MSINMSIRPIRSDSDYDAALEEVERLFASEPGTEDADRLEVLLVLAQDYQGRHFPIGPPDIQSAIMYELDKRGLTPEAMTTRESAETHTVTDTRQGVQTAVINVGNVKTGRKTEAAQRSKT